MKPHAFGRRLRVRRSVDYARVFADGRSWKDGDVIAYVLPNALAGLTRMGTSVTKKGRNAPIRNRIRRLLREAFRLERASLPAGVDFVLLTPRSARDLDLEATRQSLRRIGARASRHFGTEA